MKQNLSVFTVTRQCRWPDGENIVEVTQGGIDWSGLDALVKKYPGEFEEFEGMTAAVETAIEIAKQWQKDCPNKVINIACGNTHGMGLFLEEQEVSDEVCKEMLAEAKAFDDKLPKCVQCGETIFSEEKWYPTDEMDNEHYQCCSEHCAEELSYSEHKANIELAIEDLDREQLVELLEEACIQCYDHETDEVLREALKVSVLDGTIKLP